ncbi:MAG: oligosaccharide flippase family protein [Firmicutes bacterium]|nr:oligosaccharide flippase family protein [Bacillota bacterium]
MRKTLAKAVLILTIFAVVDRLLGFGFKIFLARELGPAAIGIYQVALSLFFVFLTLTTSGIPLIVSKFTAIHKNKGNLNAQHSTVTAAFISGIVTSVIIAAVFLIFRNSLANVFASPASMTLVLLLLPAVIFSGIFSAFRGYLWGHEKYITISIIELCEQIVRIGLCVLLFALGFDRLRMTAVSLSAAVGLTAVLCVAAYIRLKGRLRNPKGYIKPLLKQSVPITMIRASNTLVGSLIAIVVPFLLMQQGLTSEESMYIFGASVGMALPLLYIPIVAVGSLSYVMIPTLSRSYAQKDMKSVQKQVTNAIAFAIVVASFFIPLLAGLGENLGIFIYGPENALAGRFVRLSAWILIPMAIESITSSMMNSLDLQRHSFFNYLIGAGIMFTLMFSFIRGFRIEIFLIGMFLSLTTSSVLDILVIRRKVGIKLNVIPTLIKCLVLCFPTLFLVRSLHSLLMPLPMFLNLGISGFTGFVFMGALMMVFSVYDFGFKFKKRPLKKLFGKKKPS